MAGARSLTVPTVGRLLRFLGSHRAPGELGGFMLPPLATRQQERGTRQAEPRRELDPGAAITEASSSRSALQAVPSARPSRGAAHSPSAAALAPPSSSFALAGHQFRCSSGTTCAALRSGELGPSLASYQHLESSVLCSRWLAGNPTQGEDFVECWKNDQSGWTSGTSSVLKQLRILDDTRAGPFKPSSHLGRATISCMPQGYALQHLQTKELLHCPGPFASASPLSRIPRGLATQGALPPGATAQQKPIKVYLQSPGILADPYKPPDPPLPFVKSWFSREGWQRRREWFMDALRTGYAIALLRRNTKNYTKNGFYTEIAHNYSKIIQALAADDRTELRHYVTESVFSSMKGQLKQRSQAGVGKVEWRLTGGLPKISTFQARLVALDKSNPENSFIQVTLKIVCKQILAVYNKKGKLLTGNPNEEIPVEDVWVFERHLLQRDSPWRLCGQLLQAGGQKLPGGQSPGKIK